MKKILKLFIYTFYLSLILFILLEVAIRIWGYAEHYISDPIYMPFEGSDEIPYIIKPNLKNVRTRGLSIIYTDSLGLRSKVCGQKYGEKKKNEYRIAVVGDSVTFGEGVRKGEDTYCDVLEKILNQRQKEQIVKVFNFSVSAYSVKEMAATLEHRMLDLDPDLVLMAIIQEDMKLSRTPDIDRWGYTTMHSSSHAIFSNSYLKLILRKIRLAYLLRDIMRKHQEKDSSSSGNYIVPDSYKYITKFKKIAEENQVPYVIVLLGYKEKPFQVILQKFQEDNIVYIDISKALSDLSANLKYASQFDRHPSAKAHSIYGEQLADHILNNHLSFSKKAN